MSGPSSIMICRSIHVALDARFIAGAMSATSNRYVLRVGSMMQGGNSSPARRVGAIGGFNRTLHFTARHRMARRLSKSGRRFHIFTAGAVLRTRWSAKRGAHRATLRDELFLGDFLKKGRSPKPGSTFETTTSPLHDKRPTLPSRKLPPSSQAPFLYDIGVSIALLC